MLKTTKLKALSAAVLMAALFLMIPLALAQEATAEAVAEVTVEAPPAGGGLLFLLLGLGAIALIAVIWLVRERTETATGLA